MYSSSNPYVFESEQTIMCCFLRIHFSIPFSNRRFLTSDRLSHNPPEPPRSQFSNFNHSHGQHSCRQRERDYYPSNSTVYCSQPTNAYRHPKTIQHSEFMIHEQSYIHPSTEQWFSILEETKSPLFSRIHCFPVHTSPTHRARPTKKRTESVRTRHGPRDLYSCCHQLLTSIFTFHFECPVTCHPNDWPIGDPPAREKNARRVRKVARNTSRCLRAPVPLPPASDVTRGVLLALARSRERGTRGVNVEDATRTELFESLASGLPVTRWRDVKGETWTRRLERVPTTTGASRRIKGRIGGRRVAMRRAAKPAPAGYHQIDRNKLTLARLPPPPL